jgi:hypothetical protein
VSSLGALQRLALGAAQPPPVAVLQVAEDDEPEVAMRHSTPLSGRARGLDDPTRYPRGRNGRSRGARFRRARGHGGRRRLATRPLPPGLTAARFTAQWSRRNSRTS